MARPQLIYIWALALVWSVVFPGTAVSQERTPIQFLSVAPDADTKLADQKLLEYLRHKVPVTFEKQEMGYESSIQTLVDWDPEKQGPLLARVTPYAFVVAEMLGANMEIVGTYLNKSSNSVTGDSYFVVHKDFGYEKTEALEDFARHLEDPKAQTKDFIEILKQRETPARFVYHSKFSTSSHFLPSLYFKSRGIFSLFTQPKGKQKFITIHSLEPDGIANSSELIPIIKGRQADFAAVRGSVKSKFDTNADLKFIKLPYSMPNDLLIMVKPFNKLIKQIKDQILETLRKMEATDIDEGDILKWEDFNASPKARKSLANLRHLAKTTPHPVVVNIRKSQKENSGIDEKHLEAARQAVRFSGTEMILFDEDYHSAFDVLWTLETRHDQSILLTSTIMDSGLTQEFSVSYRNGDMENLASRISRVIDYKMHRIRYVWPFDDDTARVLRDVDFQIPVGQQLKVQKITWSDFNTNEYTVDTPFNVEVTHSDFHSFQLKGKGFPQKEDGKYGFEPLGNVAYRVFLERTPNAGDTYKLTTKVLIGLLGLAALFTLVEVMIKPKPPGSRKEKS
jgi:ABC-type phosphate/phosphonate transport system substrate-binding protein